MCKRFRMIALMTKPIRFCPFLLLIGLPAMALAARDQKDEQEAPAAAESTAAPPLPRPIPPPSSDPAPTARAEGPVGPAFVVVDQFGYLSRARKVAVVGNPIEGFNGGPEWTPGSTFQVRDRASGEVVFEGDLVGFQDGTVDKASGDRVWWADFSALTEPGDYAIVEPSSGVVSHEFRIGDDVYDPVLKAAGRMFYYNRANVRKLPEHAGAWTHGENHPQAREAQLYDTAPRGARRDVSGGWWDAGDFNKYSRFATDAMWDLLAVAEAHPDAFGDNWTIPESNNGTADMLDELRWQFDWLLKMQRESDGGVFNVAGTIGGGAGMEVKGDPASATQEWFYTAPTTWSTAGFSAATAQGSRVFRPVDPAYADLLLAASKKAWSYLESHPQMDPPSGHDLSNGTIGAGDSTGLGGRDQRLRILAAAELFATVGEENYNAYFLANHLNPSTTDEGHHPILDREVRSHHGRDLNRAYFRYIQTPGADSKVVTDFRRSLLRTTLSLLKGIERDGYRNDFSYYWWGSNGQRAQRGELLLWAVELGLAPQRNGEFLNGALEYLHYFHGRNPMDLVYLTNMGADGVQAGAERSVTEIYHYWFGDGTRYDGVGEGRIGPAPGYLAGGPNKLFQREWISPPAGQPPGKSFRQWNSGWNEERGETEESWSITEPGIYYQSSYVALLARALALYRAGAGGTPVPSQGD